MSDLWQSLSQDVRTTILIVAAVGGFLAALYWVGRLLSWRRKESMLPWGMALGGLAFLAAAGSLYLDMQPSIPGVVESKSERIVVDNEGTASHELLVRVRFTRPDTGQPRSDELRADPAIYDRVSAGDAVEVRFLHVGGLISLARLSERSTLSMLFQAASNPVLYIVAAFVGLMGLLWLLSKAPALRAISLALLVALVGLALVVTFLPQWRAGRPLRGAQESTVATVQEVDRFTEVGGGEENAPEPLIQPFDLVQVSFVPADRRDAVLAADIVDAGSLALEAGGSVAISYLVENPRQIRLQGGTRSYAWKNVSWSAAMTGAALLFMGALLVGWRVVRGRMGRRIGPPGKAASSG